MATNQTNDNSDMIAVIASLAAVGAVIYAVLRQSGGSTIVNIPEGFGQSESDDTPTADDMAPGDSTPDNLPSPDGQDWQYEEPSDNPDNSDTSLDFGNSDPAPPDSTAGTTIPDSLAAFDPAGRVELINDGEQVGL